MGFAWHPLSSKTDSQKTKKITLMIKFLSIDFNRLSEMAFTLREPVLRNWFGLFFVIGSLRNPFL
jgi:hypothetical protein